MLQIKYCSARLLSSDKFERNIFHLWQKQKNKQRNILEVWNMHTVHKQIYHSLSSWKTTSFQVLVDLSYQKSVSTKKTPGAMPWSFLSGKYIMLRSNAKAKSITVNVCPLMYAPLFCLPSAFFKGKDEKWGDISLIYIPNQTYTGEQKM